MCSINFSMMTILFALLHFFRFLLFGGAWAVWGCLLLLLFFHENGFWGLWFHMVYIPRGFFVVFMSTTMKRTRFSFFSF